MVAFTDSTVFSNFSVFFRGKPELGLGLIEYLDREPSPWTIPLRLGAAAGLLLIAFPFVWVRLREKAQLRPARPLGAAAVLVLTVVAVGWIAGAAAATSVNAASLRLPVPREPMTTVVFDREHSAYRLPTLIETNPVQPERCFDAFYTATQRIHLFPRIAEQLATDAESAQAVVFLNPESTPAPEEFERLYAWVRGGGRLLIMEPMRGTHVAANRLLEPAGLRISASFPGQGAEIPAVSGYSIYGAPSFLLGEAAVGDSATPQPIVAAADLGSGRVAVVLGSESFSLQTMGPSFNNPTPRQQAIYDRVYRLFEEILFDDEAWGQECRLAGFVRRQDATPAGRSGR